MLKSPVKSLIGVLFLLNLHTPAWAAEWSLGMALQARVQNQVNPDFYETRALAQMFARTRVVPWSGLLEVGEEQRNTSSGALSVNVRTRSFGLWGRFEPLAQYAWSPYMGMGTGVYEDRVQTYLGYEGVEKTGRRFYLGGAVGISRTIWQQCMLELEVRGQSIEQNVSPVFSALVRAGYTF